MLRRTIHLAALVALASAAAPVAVLAQKAVGKPGLTLSSVADSAALTAALAGMPGRPASGGSQYSVHFGGNGVPDEVTTLSAPATPFDSAVIGLLREHLARRRSAAPGTFLYLIGSWGARPRLATDVPTIADRMPELVNLPLITQGLERITAHFSPQIPGARVQVSARMEVDVQGVPHSITLSQGTGIAELDRAIVALLGSSRYRAAVLDGHPSAAWVVFPINLVAAPGAPTAQD